GPARHACVPRQALAPRRRGAGPYLPPILTVSRARPRRRRRFRTLRPPRVAMRARNPCLLTRLRLRGLYVGFMRASPSHLSTFENELEKIRQGGERGQRVGPRPAENPHQFGPSDPFDFSTPPR